MKTVHRRIKRAIATAIPGASVEVLRSNRHVILGLSLGDVTGQITVSNSPTNYDHAVLNACRDAKKALGVGN